MATVALAAGRARPADYAKARLRVVEAGSRATPCSHSPPTQLHDHGQTNARASTVASIALSCVGPGHERRSLAGGAPLFLVIAEDQLESSRRTLSCTSAPGRARL